MMRPLDGWLDLGCDNVHGATRRRKIRSVNVSTYVVVTSVLFYHLLCLLIGAPGLVTAAWELAPFYPVLLAAPWLNHLGLHRLARWVLPLGVTMTVAANIWCASGSLLGLHFYFISVIAVAPVFFAPREWPAIVFIFVLNTALFLWVEYIWISPTPELLTLPTDIRQTLSWLHTGTSLLTALLISLSRDRWASRNEDELDALSSTDPLTGLPNRRRLMQRLSEVIAMNKRDGQYGAVLFLDLDHFKQLNDLHGHSTGDLLLQDVGQRMQSCIRETDMVARLGGDEFVVLLTLLGGQAHEAHENARGVADKIHAALSAPYKLVIRPRGLDSEQLEHQCTASIGAVVFQGAGEDTTSVLSRADAAMYQSKARGRNGVYFHPNSA